MIEYDGITIAWLKDGTVVTGIGYRKAEDKIIINQKDDIPSEYKAEDIASILPAIPAVMSEEV